MFDQEDQVEGVTETEEELEDEAEEVVDEDEDTEADETKGEDEGEVAESDDDEEEAGLVVSLGDDDEDEDEDQSPVIRSMREKLRDQKKRIKELEANAENETADAVQLGEKPTLESVDYDSDKFEAALLEWNEKKRKSDADKQVQAERQEAMQKHYDERLASYQTAKQSLGARGFEDAEDAVRETLSTAQQSIIVANAKQPAILVYALGKNPDMMKELAEQPDLASFAFRLGQIESGMKVTGMNKKPAPEKRLQGRSQAPASGSKKLEQLRSEAEKTGDYSKVTRYKKELRSQ